MSQRIRVQQENRYDGNKTLYIVISAIVFDLLNRKKRTRERGLARKEKRRLVHTKLCKSGVSLPSAFVLPVLYTHIRLCSTHLEVGDCYKHAVCCPICLRGLTSLKQKKISSKFFHFYISSVPL